MTYVKPKCNCCGAMSGTGRMVRQKNRTVVKFIKITQGKCQFCSAAKHEQNLKFRTPQSLSPIPNPKQEYWWKNL